MPARNTSNFDFTKLTFTEAKPNKRGGNYATVAYGDETSRVEFQLGTFPNDLLQSPWGVDSANPQDPASGLQIKLNLSPSAKTFLNTLEQSILKAAEHHSISWFKKKLTKDKIVALYNPIVKEDESGDHPDRVILKVFEKGSQEVSKDLWTTVTVVKKKGGKYTKPFEGTLADVTANAWVVPVVKVKSGVYFMNGKFGTSLVATEILVVKEEGETSGGSRVDTGDIVFADEDAEMTEADDGEEESD